MFVCVIWCTLCVYCSSSCTRIFSESQHNSVLGYSMVLYKFSKTDSHRYPTGNISQTIKSIFATKSHKSMSSILRYCSITYELRRWTEICDQQVKLFVKINIFQNYWNMFLRNTWNMKYISSEYFENLFTTDGADVIVIIWQNFLYAKFE